MADEIKHVESLEALIAVQKQVIENQAKVIVNDAMLENDLRSQISCYRRIIERLVDEWFRDEKDIEKLLELCE